MRVSDEVAKRSRAGTQPRSRVGAGRRVRRGFTLIEVLIVLAIVLALGGIVGVAVLGRSDEAKVDLAKVDLNTLEAGLKQFRFDFNRWPTDDEGLAVLWNQERLDPDADPEQWRGYLEQPLASDRWGNEFGYTAESEFSEDASQYDLWSNGPDGEEGTDDDITARPMGDDLDDMMGGDDGMLPPP